MKLIQLQNKIATNLESALIQVNSWKEEGDQIVFTNGCFDLLHRGHIRYLIEAKEQGNRLVVGLNSDASVKRLKGKERPVKDERNRLECLAALQMTDLVLVFEDDTPLNLIETLTPNVLVKGGDWAIDQIVGSAHVIEQGGKVKSLSYIDGESSTNLINKINDNG